MFPDCTFDGPLGAGPTLPGTEIRALAASRAARTPLEIPPGYRATCNSHLGVEETTGALG
jgi:hypothetical protein